MNNTGFHQCSINSFFTCGVLTQLLKKSIQSHYLRHLPKSSTNKSLYFRRKILTIYKLDDISALLLKVRHKKQEIWRVY